jgi:hypothetical protein
MARIWKERFDPVKHGGPPYASVEVSQNITQHYRAPTLTPHEVVFVHVCSFTFRFDTEEQLRRVLEYYERKLQPSSREPLEVVALRGGDTSEAQRWFERLPLFLREETKRHKVVKALREAVAQFSAAPATR